MLPRQRIYCDLIFENEACANFDERSITALNSDQINLESG
jgi:hypothetical protein